VLNRSQRQAAKECSGCDIEVECRSTTAAFKWLRFPVSRFGPAASPVTSILEWRERRMIRMPAALTQRCILYVEDDDNDVFFLRLAFSTAGIVDSLHVVRDGQEAVEYLEGAGVYADRKTYPLPSLVLLDLQLPLRDGMEVLKWIRTTHALKGLVVIMFTSSHHPRDLDTAYELGVNSFVVKPMTISDRAQFARELKAWWLQRNQLPEACAWHLPCHSQA
jgi:CheY-like chemotaxis protein